MCAEGKTVMVVRIVVLGIPKSPPVGAKALIFSMNTNLRIDANVLISLKAFGLIRRFVLDII